MTFKVPYLVDTEIEAEASALLKSFEAKHGRIQTPATPLEEIIETHLGLYLEIRQMEHPGILGELDIQENVIRINEALDPYANPDQEGRYNYTGGHEVGHQVLHRPIVEEMMRNASLFDDNKEPENIILCRSEEKKAMIEVQADKFASYLLMPKEKVITEFMGMHGGRRFISLPHLIQALRHNRDFLNKCFYNWRYIPSDDELLYYAFRDLAKLFGVSMQAMVIRLKTLGLLGMVEQEEMMFV